MASEKTAIEIAKEKWERLAHEMRSIYKKDGEDELAILYKEHRPDVLFRSGDTPDVRQRIAVFLSELGTVRNELAEAAAHRARTESKKLAGAVEKPVKKAVVKPQAIDGEADEPKKDPPDTIKGNYEGFSYKIVPKNNKEYWIVRVRMREIVPVEGAPNPYKSPVLATAYKRASDAEIAFRRSIQDILHWYDNHNTRLIFKPPITERMKAGRLRRTPAKSAERQEKMSDKARQERNKKRKEVLEKRKFMRESARGPAPMGPSGTESGSRSYFYPGKKKNPSRLLSMLKPGSTPAGKAAVEFYKRYEKVYDSFEKSAEKNEPDYKSLMDAYDLLALSRGNYELSDNSEMAKAVFAIKKKLKNEIIENLNMCQELIRSGGIELGPSKNPSKNPLASEHMLMANGWLEKAEVSWRKYRDGAGPASLIATLKNAEISREEFKHSGAKNARANELCKLARSEIQKRIKGS